VVAPGVGKGGSISGGIFPAGIWSLTYDDGPSTKYTPSVLENLKRNGIKATFFWLYQNAKLPELAAIVKQAGEEGHGRANHSISHANLPKVSDARLFKEVAGAQEGFTQLYGEAPRFFRCPYGAGVTSPRIRKVIADQNLIHVFWNVDTLDWQDKNPDSVVARAEKQMALLKGGIVLFHDIHPQSVIASNKLIEKTKAKLHWEPLSQIVDEINGVAPEPAPSPSPTPSPEPTAPVTPAE
jgi:peptidoglycan/xylan/chitin deacetylase (PgdA/CDA1 family)